MHRLRFAPGSLLVAAVLAVSSAAAMGAPPGGTRADELKALAAELAVEGDRSRREAVDLARQMGWLVRKEFPDGRIVELQRLGPFGEPVYYTTLNADAADSVGTDELWPGGSRGLGLTGSGMTVGEWDGGGVRITHDELFGRVTQRDVPSALSSHATHVAGTLVGTGVVPAAKGMAFDASLDAYDWNSDESEMADAAAEGLLLSNHSYGSIAGWYQDNSLTPSWKWYGYTTWSQTEDWKFGFYNSEAREWDQIAYAAPYYLIVKSAGNDRNDTGPAAGGEHWVLDYSGDTATWVTSTEIRNTDCAPDGYDCITTKGNAKNILTIGAVEDIVGGYAAPEDVVMSSFSGWGPTDDGRIKPDLVANGTQVYSSVAWGDSAYADYWGTSMSSPSVTGSLLLLQQHYQDTHGGGSMRSATLKALAIHTADEAGGADGPDYAFGWGMLNTASAAALISADGSDSHIIEDTLADGTGQTLVLTAAGGEPVKATLVWTDPAGTVPAYGVDPTDLMLVHDLDLRLNDGLNLYSPWVLDPDNPANAATTGDNTRDNVEQVVMENPGAGQTISLDITHKGGLASAQPYSLVISGASTTVYTASASAGTGGSVTPTFRTVTDGSAASFTVVADVYYTRDDAVGGTCPAGSWSGNEYSTGPVIGDCTVSFSFDPPIALAEAVDNGDLAWATAGNAQWYGQSATAYSGGDAAQSGELTDNQNSDLTATVTGPGTLSFYWQVSSETSYDFLTFYIDGVSQAAISGEAAWAQRTYELEAGEHTLKWSYARDSYLSAGADAGWVDLVTFTRKYSVTASAGTGGSVTPASATVTDGATTTFTVTADTGYATDAAVGGTCAAGSWSGSDYTTGPVSGDCSVSFTFTPVTYTVSASAGTGGGVAPASQIVAHGATATFTVAPDSGYSTDAAVGGTCQAGTWNGGDYTTGAISGGCSVSFSFSQVTHTVGASASTGGGVSPATQTVADGGSATFTVIADSGYTADTAVGGTCPAGSWSGSDYTTGAVSGDCSVSFSFTERTLDCSVSDRTYAAGEVILCEDASRIETGPQVVVGDGADVTYRAPVVVLNPSFRAALGARFHAVSLSP